MQMRASSSSTARAAAARGRAAAAAAPGRITQQQQQRRATAARVAAGEPQAAAQLALPRQGHMLISKTEVPSFIQRDDMMDQLYRWALIEAAEGGMRNFGMPMKVAPQYYDSVMWGFDVEILKEGVKKADLGVNFDGEVALKHEWVGRDQDGFPRMEGDAERVMGKHIEIWKLNEEKVDEDTRATVRAFCNGLVTALNKYYAFGSVFAEEL